MTHDAFRRGRVSIPGQQYLVTTVTDCRRSHLRHDEIIRHLAREVRRLETDGDVKWFAWVIMPDHFHGILELGDLVSLSTAMKRLKGRAARAAGIGPLWQSGFHDHALRNATAAHDAMRYLVANPVRAGLVDRIADYPHWYCASLTPGDDPDQLLYGEPGARVD